MQQHNFDDRDIRWNTLESIPHLAYAILGIDEKSCIIDVLFKFAARQQIVLHRHMAPNHMLVIQGEHWLYEADGSIKEIRPAGTYTASPASPEPHREGGGDTDAIVMFSIRGGDGVLYEILDDELNCVGTLGMADFVGLYQAQSAAGDGA